MAHIEGISARINVTIRPNWIKEGRFDVVRVLKAIPRIGETIHITAIGAEEITKRNTHGFPFESRMYLVDDVIHECRGALGDWSSVIIIVVKEKTD